MLKRKGSHLLTILLKFNKHRTIGSSTNFPPIGQFRLLVKLFSQVNPKLFGILLTCLVDGGGGWRGGGQKPKIGATLETTLKTREFNNASIL